MKIRDKLERFRSLENLNERIVAGVLHAVIIFDQKDHLSDALLTRISDKYMYNIGHSSQPYLVYRHNDSSQPHVHVISSLIKSDGTSLKTQKPFIRLTISAARSIESEFGLHGTISIKPPEREILKGSDIPKVRYGKSNVLEDANAILAMCLRDYHYSNMKEFNALLRQYNLYADRCLPGSRVFENKGLYYRILDNEGNRLGTPIKASQLFCKPTLPRLEQKFEESRELQLQAIPSIKSRVAWAMVQNPNSLAGFAEGLKKEGIDLVITRDEGIRPEFIFVDRRSRTVANGAIIGKEYQGEEILKKYPRAAVLQAAEKKNLKIPQPLGYLLQQYPEKNDNVQRLDRKQQHLRQL